MSRGNHPIKSGDKLYIITRHDMAPGYQAVQSCHALRKFVADHPEIDSEWYTASNYLALLSTTDEVELMRLIVKANDHGVKWSAFREPDVDGSITAIVLEPSRQSSEICRDLNLALRSGG
jgi:peptidyl-tRNA hydrolase